MTEPLLRAEHLHKVFPTPRGAYGTPAGQPLGPVVDISFDIQPGEIVALAGERGAGKSSLVRTLAVLARADKGKIIFEGRDLTRQGEGALRPVRRRLQVLFGDPRTALNPANLVADVMLEPLKVQRIGSAAEQLAQVKTALRQVGLNSLLLDRRMTALSAGQRQRVALARLLTLNPKLILCDDPTRTLTPLAAEQLFKLMADLRERRGIAFLWLVRDAALVRPFADRLGFLLEGRLVEFGPTAAVLDAPRHPYSLHYLQGRPAPANEPAELAPSHWIAKGCPFQERCPQVMPVCRATMPALLNTPGAQMAACHLFAESAPLAPAPRA